VNVRAEADAIVVCDNGPGIPADLLPHIFQPHVSTKSIFSGLGLYVVQSIVEQHGGAVSAGNRPEGGAQFRISL
jgi:signal transduction histidine kinase